MELLGRWSRRLRLDSIPCLSSRRRRGRSGWRRLLEFQINSADQGCGARGGRTPMNEFKSHLAYSARSAIGGARHQCSSGMAVERGRDAYPVGQSHRRGDFRCALLGRHRRLRDRSQRHRGVADRAAGGVAAAWRFAAPGAPARAWRALRRRAAVRLLARDAGRPDHRNPDGRDRAGGTRPDTRRSREPPARRQRRRDRAVWRRRRFASCHAGGAGPARTRHHAQGDSRTRSGNEGARSRKRDGRRRRPPDRDRSHRRRQRDHAADVVRAAGRGSRGSRARAERAGG